jgi:hypothetical protein
MGKASMERTKYAAFSVKKGVRKATYRAASSGARDV